MYLKLTIYATLIIVATFTSIRQAPEHAASPERFFWTAVAITCFLLVFEAVPLFLRRLGITEAPLPEWERILRTRKPKWSGSKVEKLNRLAGEGEHLEVMGNQLGVMPAVVESKMISLGIYPEYVKARTSKIQKELVVLESEPVGRRSHGSVGAGRSKRARSLGSGEVNKAGLERALNELNKLTGLSRLKTEIRSITALAEVRSMRSKEGLPINVPTAHLVFAGNPGTGKTTVVNRPGN